MPKFTIVTPKGASFTVAGGGYDYEMEALEAIGAEIVEAPANEAEFIAVAKHADAIYGKGMRITKAIIDSLEKIRALGCSVFTQSQHAAEAPAAGRRAPRYDLEDAGGTASQHVPVTDYFDDGQELAQLEGGADIDHT